MTQRTRVNISLRPTDLALLDLLASLNGLNRSQMVESLTRSEIRLVGPALTGEKRQQLHEALTSGQGVTR